MFGVDLLIYHSCVCACPDSAISMMVNHMVLLLLFSKTFGSDSAIGLCASILNIVADKVAWNSDFSVMFWSSVRKACISALQVAA